MKTNFIYKNSKPFINKVLSSKSYSTNPITLNNNTDIDDANLEFLRRMNIKF